MPKMALLFTFLFFIPLTANAAEKATWKSEMSEVSKDGSPIVTIAPTQHTLVMNQNGDKVSSFDFTDGNLLPSPAPAPKTTRYRVLARVDVGCGSKLYLAISGNAALMLTDHRHRMCDDMKPALWEMQLRGIKNSRRFFRGTPNAISEFAACDNLGMTVCTQVYLPTTCTLSEADGVKVDPAITVSGSNSCFASQAMKSAMCSRGLNPDLLEKSNMLCAVKMPCPLPMCAAPPEGCTLQPSSDLDQNGCPVNPCGVLVCPPK